MQAEYERLLDFAVGNGRFNDHPNDWDRFNDFVIAVWKGAHRDRVLESDLQAALIEAMPAAVERVNEMVTVYGRGLGLLDRFDPS